MRRSRRGGGDLWPRGKEEGKAARLPPGEERGRPSRKVDAAPRGIQS